MGDGRWARGVGAMTGCLLETRRTRSHKQLMERAGEMARGGLSRARRAQRIIMEASNIPFFCLILVLPLSASCSRLLFA